MTKTRSKKKYIEVVVFWGGSELGRYQKPLASCRGVTAGSSLFSNIRSRVWPRWDELEILTSSRSGLILNPSLPWDGVLADGNGTFLLSSMTPQRKIIPITNSTSGSLRLGEMTVLIRVGDKPKRQKDVVAKKSGYSGSPFMFIADLRAEWAALMLALVGSGIICASMWWGLTTRHQDKHTAMQDLPEDRLLPFLAQSYLANAPNVIQAGLDRFNFVHSVWTYYTDFAKSIGFGEDPGPESPLFPSTVEYYRNLANEQAAAFSNAEAAQNKKISAATNRNPMLSIPTVRGESLDGRAQRIFDKIGIVASSADELASDRNKVAEKFLADVGYKFEERKERNVTQEAFAKISAGFMGVESDDKMQAKQASEAASKAALSQMNVYGREHLTFGVQNGLAAPAGSPLTQDGLTWLRPDLRSDDAASLSEFRASTWGAVGSKSGGSIAEPKAGQVDPTAVEKTVSAGRYQLRLCYEMALRRNQTTRGSMEWRWTIDTQGRASGLNLISTSIKDDDLVKCVRDKIASWRFPRPEGGSVEVRYPFEFAQDKG